MDTIKRTGRMALMFCVLIGLVAGDAFGQRQGRGGGSERGRGASSGSESRRFSGATRSRGQVQSGRSSQRMSVGGQSIQSRRGRSSSPSIRSGSTPRPSVQPSPRSLSNPGSRLGTSSGSDRSRTFREYRSQPRPSISRQTAPSTGQRVVPGVSGRRSPSVVNPQVAPGGTPSRSAISPSDRSSWRSSGRRALPSDSATTPNRLSRDDLNQFFRQRSNRGTVREAPDGATPGRPTPPAIGSNRPGRTFDRDVDSLRRQRLESATSNSGADRQRTGGTAGSATRDRNGDRDRFRDWQRSAAGRSAGADRANLGTRSGDRGRFGSGDRRRFDSDWRRSIDGVRVDDATRRRIAEHRHTAARHVRHDWHSRFHRDGHRHDIPFRSDWWRRHDHHHHDRHHHHAFHHYVNHHHHVHRPYYWWRPSTVPIITTWFTFGWPRVYYWNYGPGEYIHCYNNVIYVNGQWFAPAPVYYRHTVLLAQSAPELTPEQAAATEWLPLGVWALTPEGQPEANLLLQIATTSDGRLGGTVFHEATGQAYPLEGMVDQETQRAAWTFVDENNQQITMETGIFNFTRPEATMLAHFGPDRIEVWQMVRLEEPQNGAAQAAANGAAAALPAPAGQAP